MLLSDYQWSLNPRGLHVAQAYESPPDYTRWTQPHMGWVKLVAAGVEYADDAEYFLAHNITPIVRLYVPNYGAGPFSQALQQIVQTFVRSGVKWFEFYNEPNLGVEWPQGFNPSWQDNDNVIHPLMENWLLFAEYVISLGCYPGFIPLSESVDPRYATIPWMDAFLTYLAQNEFDRFRAVLANGCWCATHPYIYNHFYQEGPGGALSMRSSGQETANQGGWHFEYPYDPVSQANDPGRTVYGGTPDTPYGDPNGLTAVGRMFNERCANLFGLAAVPVVGTEGGIFPFRDNTFQQDTRYPSYNEQSQGEATLAMFEWIANEAPAWFFGVCLWKEDEYYLPGHVPAIDRMGGVAPVYKNVPPQQVMGGPGQPPGTPQPIGPGPIHGQADFHMILLGPGLDTQWFFDTAQAYWNAFRPMVTTHEELIQLVPSTRSLAVTVIATPDTLDLMQSQIKDRYANVWYDPITADTIENVAATFNLRARVNRRFG